MSTTILLKRSLNTSIPSSLANGEPAYTANGDVFYIGSNGTIVAIGGKRVPGVLTANQALVTNSTNMLDKLMLGNSTVNAVANSLGLTLANSTVTFTLSKPTAAQVTSGDYFQASDGTWKQAVAEGTATDPGGANTQIQFNDSGVFGADAGLTYNKDGTLLVVGNSTVYVATNSQQISFNGDTVLHRASSGVLQTDGSLLVSSHLQLLDDNWEIHADGTNGMIYNVYSGNDRGHRFRNSADGYDLLSIDTNSNTLFVNTAGGSVFVGNSTVNAVVNSIGIALNGTQVVVNNSIIKNGANVSVDTVKAAFGNSTVNATVNSVAFALNGTQVVNATGVSAGILYGNQINSTANVSITSANISLPNANVSVKDLNVSGNLVVSGTVTTVDATNLQVKDSMIKLADQNASDTIDIGFYGLYNDGSNRYTGLFRDATNGRYVLFANNLAEPTTTVDISNTSYAIATLQSYLLSGNLVSNSTGVAIGANSTYAVTIVANTLSLSTALPGTSGGTGKATMASESILVGNTTNGYRELTFTGSSILQTNSTAVYWSDTVDCGTF